VDFVVRSPLPEVGRRLKAHGIPSSLRRGGVREGGFPCLRGTLDGVGFDILPPLVDRDWERAMPRSY
jgi:hypothetical protein